MPRGVALGSLRADESAHSLLIGANIEVKKIPTKKYGMYLPPNGDESGRIRGNA